MKRIYKILFAILILLIFIGTVILIAMGNPEANQILQKTP